MSDKNLNPDIEFVEEHEKELLEKYINKYILVHNRQVIGSFDTYELAAKEGVRLFGIDDTFLVYQVLEEEPVNFILSANL